MPDRHSGWTLAVDRYDGKPNGDRLVRPDEHLKRDWYEAHPEAWELVEVVPAEEAEKWKRIAQDRCSCVRVCGDTPEESGGICKELPRG